MANDTYQNRGPDPPDPPAKPKSLVDLIYYAIGNPIRALSLAFLVFTPFVGLAVVVGALGLALIIVAAKFHAPGFTIGLSMGTFGGGSAITFAAIRIGMIIRNAKAGAMNGETRTSKDPVQPDHKPPRRLWRWLQPRHTKR